MSQCIKDQPLGVYDQESFATARPKVIQLGRELAKTCEAIFISCAADPGVEELRGELPIPVVGAGESMAAIARAAGSRVGLISLGADFLDSVKETLGSRLIDRVEVLKRKPDSSLEDLETISELIAATIRLERRRANVIALGCTGFSTFGLSAVVAKEVHIPVIDPVLAAGSILYNINILKSQGREKC